MSFEIYIPNSDFRRAEYQFAACGMWSTYYHSSVVICSKCFQIVYHSLRMPVELCIHVNSLLIENAWVWQDSLNKYTFQCPNKKVPIIFATHTDLCLDLVIKLMRLFEHADIIDLFNAE